MQLGSARGTILCPILRFFLYNRATSRYHLVYSLWTDTQGALTTSRKGPWGMIYAGPLSGIEVVMAFMPKGLPVAADDLAHAPVRCASPKRFSHGPEFYFPCGKCSLCRAYDASVLAHRIDLEARYHDSTAFATLTYAPAHLPADGCLSLDHMTRFLKRLRKAYGQPLRYYYLAEYGVSTYRPHYHLVLYGWPRCPQGRAGTRFLSDGQTPDCCEHCSRISRAWGYGRVDVRPFEQGASHYLSGYAVKHLAYSPPFIVREFARWSRNPGLGFAAVDDIAADVLSINPSPDDAPVALRYADGVRPLGEYLTLKLREVLDISPEQVLAKRQEQYDRQVVANRAARRHGTSAPVMGAALAAEHLRRRRLTH